MLDYLCLGSPPCEQNNSVAAKTCLRRPPASQWSLSRTRRILDISVALFALLIFAIPMGILAACVRFTSHGKAFFSQERLGRDGRLFRIYKFRSMAETNANQTCPGLTRGGDRRVTPFGRWMRRFKLDELPQFYNVLRGDMSLVGPRPKLPQYAAIFDMSYRPGITGLATIAFRSEEEILRHIHRQQIDRFYAEHIKPKKVKLDLCYMCRATASSDLRIIGSTILSCISPARVPAFIHPNPITPSAPGSLTREETHEASTVHI